MENDKRSSAETVDPHMPVMSMALNEKHLHQLTREQLGNAIDLIERLREAQQRNSQTLREARRFVERDPTSLSEKAMLSRIGEALSAIPDEPQPPSMTLSEPLQCLRCGTIDAFGPVSKGRQSNVNECPSCKRMFKDGETCSRGGCPMGGDI